MIFKMTVENYGSDDYCLCNNRTFSHFFPLEGEVLQTFIILLKMLGVTKETSLTEEEYSGEPETQREGFKTANKEDNRNPRFIKSGDKEFHSKKKEDLKHDPTVGWE